MGARASIGIVGRLALAALGGAGCDVLLGLEDGVLVEERCEPLSTVACYSGPLSTAGVGACRTGLKRCNAAGDGYGPCEGEVAPAPERCGNAADDDCDGAVDEASADGGGGHGPAAEQACACAPGAVEVCPYGGPPATEGVGACRAGQRTCGTDGRWGPCAGEIAPRIEDCATRTDEGCDGAADCGAVLSGGLYGGPGLQSVLAIAAGAGFAIVGGELEGSLDLGAGPIASVAEHDVFVARIDADGAVRWVRRLVDEGQGRLRALAVDAAGEVAVVGELEGVIDSVGLTAAERRGFVVKLDAGGEVRWGAMLPGEPRDVAISSSGAVVVASALPTSAGGSDIAVARFGALGLPLWTREFGGAGHQEPTGVAVSARDDVILAGSFEGELQLGEGAPRLASAGMSDVFLAWLDGHGDPITSLAFGDGRAQQGGDVEVGPGGEIALSGTFEGLLDLGGGPLFADGVSAFAAGLGPAGEHHFSRAYRASAAPRLAFELDGGLVLAGDVDGPTDLGGGLLDVGAGGFDIVAARLDAGGRHVWSRRFGPAAGRSGGLRRAAGVAVDADRGRVLLAGTVTGSVDLGGVDVLSTAADVLVVWLTR
ncbi:hypothetical protein SOCE26_068450 [Sorangium cellulosum]|uniref:Uncharacterized protein n=1 Tax=Sorangium cellulosum TaxID=56 RepID=A0A2L0F1F3_SORCE|nr:hypothetical protein [Sorangium cellulosum]AUX45363.1 hypothetical protein SOCE26_068450 [Sorangium cellulosum]